MTDAERMALVDRAIDLCAALRDEKRPESWSKEFKDGFMFGCANCLSLIHNELKYFREMERKK